MNIKTKIIAAAAIALIPAVASADFQHSNKVEKKEKVEVSQESRSENIPGLGQSDTQQIRKGVRKGELTHEETTRLEEQRGQLSNQYSDMHADGSINKDERRELRSDVREYRDEVKSETRNEQTR